MTDPIETICDLKWNYPIFNLARGEFRSCCRTPSKVVSEAQLLEKGTDAFLNSDEQIASRLDLINGIKHNDCKSCWGLEESQMASPRHSSEQFWQHLKRNRIIDSTKDYTDETLKLELSKINDLGHKALKSSRPYMLEISLGNTCDMKCMYCSHHYSSQWGTELIKWGEITQDRYDREFPKAPDGFTETFWEWFETVNVHLGRIGIIGGEPLIMPDFYTFVDRLIESVKNVQHLRTKKMTFWVVTNMNTPSHLLDKFINYLPTLTKYFNLEILVSMESTGDRAEYIRNGVNWNKLVSNIDRVLCRSELNFDFGFILSLNVLNIATLTDFIKFTENLYLQYNRPVALKQNIISYPNWQSPLILTPNYADYLDECIAYMRTRVDDMPIVNDVFGRWGEYIIFLENLAASIRDNADDTTAQRRKFAQWFETYDYRRNLNLVETFPEYKEFYNMCKEL